MPQMFHWIAMALCCRSTGSLMMAPASRTLWARARADALNFVNHPLPVQLATGAAPAGCYSRLVRDRRVIVDALAECCARCAVVARGEDRAEALRALSIALVAADGGDDAAWLAEAAACGKTIVVDVVACYTCGGTHLNVDCPIDADAPSSSAATLASALRQHYEEGEGLAAVSALLRLVGWSHETLRAALPAPTPHPFAPWCEHHAEVWPQLAARVDALLDALPEADLERLYCSYATTLCLAYCWVDAEASTAGLVASSSSLLEARQRIGAIEPGFLENADRNAAFVRDLSDDSPAQAPPAQSAADAKRALAAAYLAEKRRAAADA